MIFKRLLLLFVVTQLILSCDKDETPSELRERADRIEQQNKIDQKHNFDETFSHCSTERIVFSENGHRMIYYSVYNRSGIVHDPVCEFNDMKKAITEKNIEF